MACVPGCGSVGALIIAIVYRVIVPHVPIVCASVQNLRSKDAFHYPRQANAIPVLVALFLCCVRALSIGRHEFRKGVLRMQPESGDEND
mmetsp:Transcript_1686/g.4741  ORF Transcript_1686/g.4741 Transcript_1686/m.4741 type:complete len:89 (-) Transcript_1686:106-372(-)